MEMVALLWSAPAEHSLATPVRTVVQTTTHLRRFHD